MGNIKKKLDREGKKKKVVFTPIGWEDYQCWRKTDLKKFDKINELIESAQKSPLVGVGKPEKLSSNLKGYYSRRIDRENRLVYKVVDAELIIFMARFHY